MLVLLSILQLVFVAALSPLLAGVLHKLEERFQSQIGPSVFQPYFDLAKLFRKESVVSSSASPFFTLAPYIAFTFYLFLTLVLPIVTAFPLTFGPVVDFVGGGLVFGAAATVKKLAALDSRSNYAHLGASRNASIGALAEPILVFVFIMLGVLSGTNNPYVINNVLQQSSSWYLSLLHWFVAGAFFMILIVETGQLPIESHSTGELGMIDQSMPMEYSGKELALYQWGGWMKQFILMSVFLNVFTVPFWVPMTLDLSAVFAYLGIHLLKLLALVLVFALINTTVSKYKLYKNFDFLAVAFSLAFLASIALYATGGGK
ncbi:MAG: respiratory chain complex I subunit 1 family protein [Rectinemataceae bacterium]